MGDSAKEVEIKEGFLCPICHKDMRSAKNLLTHFQELHSEEQDLLSSLKELVGKAKKKILKIDENDFETLRNEMDEQKYEVEPSKPQELGHYQTHTQFYKELRRERLDHRTTETNKLIIRLDRILNVPQADRRQAEQKIVNWLDGTNVNRCPSCAAVFNIARRQHHCRLCGSIMCNGCSSFLPYNLARTIVAPVHLESYEQNETHGHDSDSLRICKHCMEMIECRRQVQYNQNVQPTICKLYYKLRELKFDLEPSIVMYYKMWTSLTSGDTTYQLQDAQSLKGRIAKQAETLDTLSKKIQALPPEPDIQKVTNLQNAIRRSTSQYIKDKLLSLPALPTPSDLELIKKERLKKNDERSLSTTASFIGGPEVRVKKVAVTTGWSPANVSSNDAPSTSEDPLIEQINIVSNYIEQARKAHRYEEVASLQANLRMLKEAVSAGTSNE